MQFIIRYEVSVWKNKKFLEMEAGDVCTTMPMNSMPVKCTPKND